MCRRETGLLHIATGSQDKTAKLWDGWRWSQHCEGQATLLVRQSSARLTALLATGSADAVIQALVANRVHLVIKQLEGTIVRCSAYWMTDSQIVSSADGLIKVWKGDQTSGEVCGYLDKRRGVGCCIRQGCQRSTSHSCPGQLTVN